MTTLERFKRSIIYRPGSRCWYWALTQDTKGYGRIKIDGKWIRAHRFAYEHYVGPIPAGLELDHLCRLPWCVNPDHLEAVTHEENMARGNNATRVRCVHGHPYTPENTYWYRKADGRHQRHCRTCCRVRESNKYAKKRLVVLANSLFRVS